MVKVPVRVALGFASNVKTMFVLPVPMSKPLARCSHAALAVADHAALSGDAARVMESVPAAGLSTRAAYPSLNVSAAACWTERTS
jgi:hypothetical protein